MSFPTGLSVSVSFAPGSLLVQVTTALTVFGQSLSGDFSFQQTTDAGPDGQLGTSDDRKVVKIAASNVGLFLGSGSTGATLSGGTALLLITPDGMAGSISGGVTLNLGSAVTATVSSVAISFNSLISGGAAEAVNETFTVGGAAQTLSLPAGHFLTISLQGASLTLGGQTISGDLTVSRSATVTGGVAGTADHRRHAGQRGAADRHQPARLRRRLRRGRLADRGQRRHLRLADRGGRRDHPRGHRRWHLLAGRQHHRRQPDVGSPR